MLKEQKIYRIHGDSDEVFLQYNLIKKFTFSVVKTIGRKKDELHWLSLQSLLKNIRTWSACYQVSSEQQNIRITYKQRAIDRYKGIFFWNSELQSLEVTGNHPYFHKTAQNSQNPPAKDAFLIYSTSNLSWNLFLRVKSAFKRKFSFKITLYHL